MQVLMEPFFAPNMNDSCNKTLVWPSSALKCQSGVSFIGLSCLDGQILAHKFAKFDCVWTIKEPHLPYKTGLDVTQSHPLRMHNHSYKVTYQFLLWRMHSVSLFSSSVFCSCSLVPCNCFMVSKFQPLIVPHYMPVTLHNLGLVMLVVLRTY